MEMLWYIIQGILCRSFHDTSHFKSAVCCCLADEAVSVLCGLSFDKTAVLTVFILNKMPLS